MTIAYRLQDYIAEHDLSWDPVPHALSQTSIEAAHQAHLVPKRVAKAVVVKAGERFFMAVIPADHRIDLAQVSEAFGEECTLATEEDLTQLFYDCARGAVPPVGDAYGIPTVWDASLGHCPDVYFEGGDHRTLVHMNGIAFTELMRSAHPLPTIRH